MILCLHAGYGYLSNTCYNVNLLYNLASRSLTCWHSSLACWHLRAGTCFNAFLICFLQTSIHGVIIPWNAFLKLWQMHWRQWPHLWEMKRMHFFWIKEMHLATLRPTQDSKQNLSGECIFSGSQIVFCNSLVLLNSCLNYKWSCCCLSNSLRPGCSPLPLAWGQVLEASVQGGYLLLKISAWPHASDSSSSSSSSTSCSEALVAEDDLWTGKNAFAAAVLFWAPGRPQRRQCISFIQKNAFTWILWIANPLCDDTACWHAALRVLRAEAAKLYNLYTHSHS